MGAGDEGDTAKQEDVPKEEEPTTGLYRLLNAEQRRMLRDQRALVGRVRRLARRDVGLEGSPLSENTEASSSSVLGESAFCIVLAGEFNAGKTTVLNALLGRRLLETGPLPTTDAVTVLSSHPPPPNHDNNASAVRYHQITDSDVLRDLTFVDTPGTNAVLSDHAVTTLRLLPTADWVLFCTSADRPFPDSERRLLARMATDYRKRVVVVINKMDVLETAGGDHGESEKRRVADFVTEHTRRWLGARPIVLAVSAQQALAAKLHHRTPETLRESSLWKRSRFGELETFLRTHLTTRTKIQAKLLSPIGLVDKTLEDCLHKLAQEREGLQTDVATLRLLQSQVQAWQSELERQMQQIRQDVQTSWQQEGNRGHVLLRRLSWGEYVSCTLSDAARLHRHWHDTASSIVVGDGTTPVSSDPRAVQSWIHETAQTLAVRSRAQGQALMEFLGTRPSRQNRSLVGHVLAASRFEEMQRTLTGHLQQAVERHGFHHHHHRDESVEHLLRRLSQLTRVSVALQAGAVCIAVATSTLPWIDVLAGAGTATALCGAGSVVLWHGRHRAVNAYRDGWTRRGQALDEALEQIGHHVTAKVQRRIQDGIAPYQQFVQAEQERLQRLESNCHEAQVTARQLRNRIGKME